MKCSSPWNVREFRGFAKISCPWILESLKAPLPQNWRHFHAHELPDCQICEIFMIYSTFLSYETVMCGISDPMFSGCQAGQKCGDPACSACHNLSAVKAWHLVKFIAQWSRSKNGNWIMLLALVPALGWPSNIALQMRQKTRPIYTLLKLIWKQLI